MDGTVFTKKRPHRSPPNVNPLFSEIIDIEQNGISFGP